MSAQAQMRAMLDQLMGTSRDGKYIYLFLPMKSSFIHLHFFLIYAVSEGKIYQKEKVSDTMS
uniref:Uncharacterized protein n=1 Tax=Athene cunicularia TaxID=194338 RepID=A0A663MSI8_ATHCN